MENIIEVNSLNYLNLFENMTFVIKNNTFSCITGSNNCGKTTFVRMLDNYIETKNSIRINEKSIEDYRIVELSKIIKVIYAGIYDFKYNTALEEFSYADIDIKHEKEIEILKKLKLKSNLKKDISEYSEKEKVYLQVVKALFSNYQILVLDEIDTILSKEEIIYLIDFLKEYKKDNKITIIMTLTNLNYALGTDYLYVIHEKKIYLEGKTDEIIVKDNIINKAGIELPFMIDLSVKLKDYNLLDNVETNFEGMVNALWK